MDYCVFLISLELQDRLAQRARQIIQADFFEVEYPTSPDPSSETVRDAVRALHFMSIYIFEDVHYDPLLTIEVNADGTPGPLLAALERVRGAALRDLVRCSKRPDDGSGVLYDAVTSPGSRYPVAPYLERRLRRPATAYRGARRFGRGRIEEERRLYDWIQATLGDGVRRHGGKWGDLSPVGVHAELRRLAQADHAVASILAAPAPDPAPWRPGRTDWANFVMVLVGLVFALGWPGAVAALWLGPWQAATAFGLLALAGLAAQPGLRSLLGGWPGVARKAAALPLVAVFLATSFALLMTTLVVLDQWSLAQLDEFWPAWTAALPWCAAIVSAAVAVAAILLWALRRREATDPTHDPATPGAASRRVVAAMARREDRIAQNTMGSLLIVKPGGLRAAVLRTSHLLLAAIARTLFAEGFLGPMRTIHFAHWCLLDNGARLAFMSNFDGTWDSYLSDFTEKAYGGVNLAWAQCLGFPPGAYVVAGGAQTGRRFKAWARHSMAPSSFWVSAYPDLSVQMIHRNSEVAAAMRKSGLTPADASAFTRRL